MSSTKNATATRNAQCEAATKRLDGGYLRIYTGPRPDSPDTPITTQKLLAELRFGSPAFQPAVRGEARAHTITQDTAARETGLAAWYRTFQADGVTAVFDGSVGAKESDDIVMNNPNIQVNAIISTSTFSYAIPAD